ncbi:uncharacterized protein A4U43_C02F6830 [Asparagus officinalis]|uniref:Uncharacterized protein n=1 Tax=Asparagus officinalis TaxID=4686 RepID=A0A5P1FGI8_ASPOF|nr:uncharacterized protein A4U43_C02F6830 [Asparagus officinalis]
MTRQNETGTLGERDTWRVWRVGRAAGICMELERGNVSDPAAPPPSTRTATADTASYSSLTPTASLCHRRRYDVVPYGQIKEARWRLCSDEDLLNCKLAVHSLG